MNKEETLALFAQGRDAWNAWAEEMLARRAELEVSETLVDDTDYFALEAHWEAIRDWREAAHADFAIHSFDEKADFRGFLFASSADFSEASFEQDAIFHDAIFNDYARFKRAMFRKHASFFHATFGGYATFSDATFSGYSTFSRATFSGGAGFDLTNFGSYADFDHARFHGAVTFFAAHAGRAFSLDDTHFQEVPDFIQAHFEEAPRLDTLRIRLRLGRSEKRSQRFRVLKRLATQGDDHEREQEYFAEELQALRGMHDKLLPNPLNLCRKDRPIWPGGARYWFGLGYQIFSDFGRSMALPLVWWALAGIGFAWGYLSQHFARVADLGSAFTLSSTRWLASTIASWFTGAPVPGLTCLVGHEGGPLSAAIGLSIRKALPFAGVGSTEKVNQIYACLYGVHGDALAIGSPLPDRFTPVIPDAVDYLGIVQLLLSLVLLFLFLLAVRNHFRIR